ncbi:hypothetical protein C0J52_20049 [Blattella germanica]|nr:hypothetical protein C0J52_20049 [Blattella germanica]
MFRLETMENVNAITNYQERVANSVRDYLLPPPPTLYQRLTFASGSASSNNVGLMLRNTAQMIPTFTKVAVWIGKNWSPAAELVILSVVLCGMVITLLYIAEIVKEQEYLKSNRDLMENLIIKTQLALTVLDQRLDNMTFPLLLYSLFKTNKVWLADLIYLIVQITMSDKEQMSRNGHKQIELGRSDLIQLKTAQAFHQFVQRLVQNEVGGFAGFGTLLSPLEVKKPPDNCKHGLCHNWIEMKIGIGTSSVHRRFKTPLRKPICETNDINNAQGPHEPLR